MVVLAATAVLQAQEAAKEVAAPPPAALQGADEKALPAGEKPAEQMEQIFFYIFAVIAVVSALVGLIHVDTKLPK